MITAKEAEVWIRQHPTANVKEAQLALPEITETTFYKARRMVKQEKVTELKALPSPIKETKTSRMVVWLQQHPGADAKTAVANGFDSAIYYYAKAKMEGRPYKSGRRKATSITVQKGSHNGIVRHLAANPRQQRILELIMHLGLETLAMELSDIRAHVEER